MSLSDIPSRPDTAAECLEWVAEYLDLTDEAIAHLADRVGLENPSSGNHVQRDLRSMAECLRNHPELDALLMSSLSEETAT